MFNLKIFIKNGVARLTDVKKNLLAFFWLGFLLFTVFGVLVVKNSAQTTLKAGLIESVDSSKNTRLDFKAYDQAATRIGSVKSYRLKQFYETNPFGRN